MAINPAYSFIRDIAQQFDQVNFPIATATEDGRHSFRPELLKIGMLQSGTNGLPQLPDLAMEHISGFSVQNTQNWLYTTGLLGRQKVTLNASCINGNASELLKPLGIERNPTVSATLQLWDHIFQEVYNHADAATKEKIIQSAHQVNPQAMETTKWEVMAYRLSKQVGEFFNNERVKFGLAISVAVVSIIAVQIVIHKAQRAFETFIERFIGTKVLVGMLVFMAFSAATFALNFFIGERVESVRHISSWVISLWLIPVIIREKIRSIPVFIAERLAYSTFATQQRISQSVVNISDTQLQERLVLGGRKAHAIWMRTLEQAKTEGICRLLSSQGA